MAKNGSEHSPALLAAQQKLHFLRQQRQVERGRDDLAPAVGRWSLVPGREKQRAQRLEIVGLGLPSHLGWESAPLSAALRAAGDRRRNDRPNGVVAGSGKSGRPQAVEPLSTRLDVPPIDGRQQEGRGRPSSTIKLFPDIALGLLRQEETATGRIWLLLRHLDFQGQGWVSVAEAREQLTGDGSKLRVCGWRQLRNLLSRGDGFFWTRTNGRIWLRSVAKVAAALGVRRLTGCPVAIPVAALSEGMGSVRAHFYGSFHSGRRSNGRSGQRCAMPIARKSLRQICSVSEHTQRKYEKRAGISRRRNFALGPRSISAEEQESAWQHGRALFRLTDHKGKHGVAGATYLAWQLPNSYVGPHEQRRRGQQRHINRELADLFMKGMTGNGKGEVDGDQSDYRKRYYGDGHRAAKAYGQSTSDDVYWCPALSRAGRRHSQIWHLLPGKQGRHARGE